LKKPMSFMWRQLLARKITYGGIVILALFLVAALWGSARQYSLRKAAAGELSVLGKKHLATLNDLEDARARIAFLDSELAEENERVAELKRRINQGAKNTEVEVPEACGTCAQIPFPLETDNRYRRCWTDDAWSEPLRVEIKEPYDSMIIGPYKDAYGACKSELTRSERYHPVRLLAEGSGAYGFAGAHAGASVFRKLGVGAMAQADLYGSGQVSGDAALAVRLRYRMWPR